jgi:hypothetical protein
MTLRVASIARHRNLKKRTTGVIGVEEVDWGIAAVRRKVGRLYSPGVNGSWLIATPSRHGSSEDRDVASHDSLSSAHACKQTPMFAASCSAAVSEAVDRASLIVRDQHRTVIEHQQIHRPAKRLLALFEADDERLVINRAIAIQLDS